MTEETLPLVNKPRLLALHQTNVGLPGMYLHVPFCLTKCYYCDFYSIADQSLVRTWLQAMKKEITLYLNKFVPFETLYIGGGTPSLLTGSQIQILFSRLQAFRITADAEITLEANPDDITPEKLRLWKALGVNRLSLGVQSLNDLELRFLGRRHTAAQAWQALNLAREAGFDNLSTDLIYGLPGQNTAGWIETLEAILAFGLEHLSCYQLTIEEHTLLGKKQAQGEFKPATEELQRTMFLLTAEYLEDRGYLHYEISNFSRGERYISRHNSKYWQQVPYLGLGPAAHSFDGRRRWWNVRSLEEYCRMLGEGRAVVAGEELLTETQQRLETLCLGLRTRQGVALADLDHFSQARHVLEGYCQAGLLEVSRGRARPTREGFLVADSLALMLSE
jgi:oxygen-independent coproporphyrinogen-3 oxidase